MRDRRRWRRVEALLVSATNPPAMQQVKAEVLSQVAADLDATHRTLSVTQVRLVLEMIDAAGWKVVPRTRWCPPLARVKRYVSEWRGRRAWRGPVPVTIPRDVLVAVMNEGHTSTRTNSRWTWTPTESQSSRPRSRWWGSSRAGQKREGA